MENKENFYKLGVESALDSSKRIQELAQKYEKKYGVVARKQFLLGVMSVVRQYSNYYSEIDNPKADINKYTERHAK